MGGMGASPGTRGCSSAWALADSCVPDAAPPASEPPAVGAALVCFPVCNLLQHLCADSIMHATR